MAAIKIKDLGAPGSILFSDSESYLNELTEDELGGASGGFLKPPSLTLCFPPITIRTIWTI
jgi:hypothetical protein